jgi:tetratricopeptide (TPR) repeat protein
MRFPRAVIVLLPLAVARAQHQPRDMLGTVHFATSCSPAVAPTFDRAVALLHSFEFNSAIRGFTDVLAKDPTCAMAWWGIALSRWSNPMAPGNRSATLLAAGREAVNRGATLSATERERGYLSAVRELYDDYEHRDQRTRVVAYAQAMARLVTAQPADTEARIFYAIALTASALPSDKTYANQLKAGALLEQLFAVMPNHPGLAHYLIHTYDYPPLAGKADAAARRYAAIAPSAPHALHMPSHTFTRVGLWEESIATNTRSMNVAIAAGSIAEALHAADYMTYAYLQLGHDSSAKALLARVRAIAPAFDPTVNAGAAPGSAGVFALAAMPARWALERRAWKDAAAIRPKASAFPWTEALSYFTRALGAAHLGNLALAQASADSLAAIRTRLVALKEPYWTEQVAIQQLGADAWILFAKGRRDSALAVMRSAADREDATEKAAVTPGPLAPERELLGDMYAEMKRYREALAEYQLTMQREPSRARTLKGAMVAARFVDQRLASQYAAQYRRLRARPEPAKP